MYFKCMFFTLCSFMILDKRLKMYVCIVNRRMYSIHIVFTWLNTGVFITFKIV